MMMPVIDPSDLRQVCDFIRREGRGVVATVSATGSPQAALVGLAALDDGTLIFNSHDCARKIENLGICARVAVVVGTEGDVTLQLEGTAAVLVGGERERSGAAYNDVFPGSRALTDGFEVVEVRPDWVRVYDASTETPRVLEADWTSWPRRRPPSLPV
jgi:uncharacterized protein YhbP (UPF0306 family)